MRFTVASWHTQKVQYWLDRHAYTTMISPPSWSVQHNRNVAVFAPIAQIVFGGVSEETYTTVYRRLMQQRLPAIRAWIAAHADEHVILLCACPDGRFCHRILIAKLLVWLGCEDVSLDAVVKDTTEGGNT